MSSNHIASFTLKQWVIAIGCVALTAVMFRHDAQAQSCESAAQVASDLWDEYGKVTRQVGCAGITAGTVIATGGISLPAAVGQYESCLAASKKAAQTTDKMIQAWNDMANNKWATIGPRRLAMNQTQEGIIRGPATRVFVTESPVAAPALDLSIEKLRFRGKTEVTVCTHLPDGSEQTVWNFQMDPGLQNKGKTWNRELDDVAGRIVSVFLNGKSAVKSMKYELRAQPVGTLEYREPDHTVIINSEGLSGSTSYTLSGGGELEKIENNLLGLNITKQANDNVRGNWAEGVVGDGTDGYAVFGNLPSIEFDNPQNAEVFVDGNPFHTIVIDSEGISGETGYVLKGGGKLEQADGVLSGMPVTVQGNDSVSGNRAEGHVADGKDGFMVFGGMPTIDLDNPDNAVVYVDGVKR